MTTEAGAFGGLGLLCELQVGSSLGSLQSKFLLFLFSSGSDHGEANILLIQLTCVFMSFCNQAPCASLLSLVFPSLQPLALLPLAPPSDLNLA
jgi:hypothetical protein